jgi:beta-glucanase (GH16 family)
MRGRHAIAIATALLLTTLALGVAGAAPMPFCDRKPIHWKCASPTTAPTVTPTATASPTFTPTPNPGGRWTSIFRDDFDWVAAEGQFPAITSGRWSAYPHGWLDTSDNGTYDPAIVSVHDGVLDKHLRYQDGEFKVAAITPRWLNSSGASTAYQTYGRYEVRFRADPVVGYKTAWLLWPQSETWPRDGEIDFPEGSLTGSICAFMHHQGATSGSDQDAFCTSTTYADWHTAVIEWEPNRVGFYLDGALIGESTQRIPNTPMRWVIQTETKIQTTPPPTSAQGHVYLDYVEVWDYAP